VHKHIVWLCGHRKNGPNQISLLIVHHTPTLTSCYVMEFHELMWKKYYSESSHITRSEVKASCTLNWTNVRYIFSCTAVREQFTKFSPLYSLLKSLWATFVLLGCRCRRSVAFYADVGDMPIFCAGWVNSFFVGVCNVSYWSGLVFSHHMASVCVITGWNGICYSEHFCVILNCPALIRHKLYVNFCQHFF